MRRDPIELEIFKNLFHSIAEEMGAALRRTAFSPNIKERRDYSCAVFDEAGEVIAMGDHMPVHLGSMPMSVRAAIAECPMEAGDVVMLNDPFRGGTHLPDITLVAPVYVRRGPRKASNRPDFYVASRAHHSDVGGAYAGSMGLYREIYQEGFRIPPVRIMRAGVMERDVLALLLAMYARQKSARAIWAHNSRPATQGLSDCEKCVRDMESTGPSVQRGNFWSTPKS
jgi:N-methylhydantoinase B